MSLLKQYWGLLLVLLVSLLALFALLHPGLPLTHDGQDHVARIASFYQNLAEGNIVPRWAGSLNWGYGHPILMFLYPLPSYVASLFHFFGFSLVDSTKLVFALAFILSGITMYLWLKEFLSTQAAVVGAVLYNFAPYRFVDLYVRGAIGEHIAFIFPPLILYFLLKVSKSDKFNRFYFVFGSLSIAGLILSHNAISIIFLPFIIFYAIYLAWTNKRKPLLYQYAASGIIGVCLSAFFLIPAYFEGKYTLRDIVTEGLALTRFVKFKDLFISSWNYGQSGEFSVQVGILLWFAVVAGLASLFLYKKNKPIFILCLFTLIYFASSIFIMLPASKFIWKNVSILQKFQFPWRFLTISVFAASVLGAIALNYVKNIKVSLTICVLVVILTIFTTANFWQPKGYLEKPEPFYTGIYSGTTDTGESSPIWSVRFMEREASASAEVLRGSAQIKEISRSQDTHEYEINAEYRSRIRENTLYFPGWKISIDGKNYSGIQFQDPESRGLMTYYVPSGKHKVVVKFEDTRLRQISNAISLGALVLVIGILLKNYRDKTITKKPRS